MSQSTKTGRRTPLSLSGAAGSGGGKHSKNQHQRNNTATTIIPNEQINLTHLVVENAAKQHQQQQIITDKTAIIQEENVSLSKLKQNLLQNQAAAMVTAATSASVNDKNTDGNFSSTLNEKPLNKAKKSENGHSASTEEKNTNGNHKAGEEKVVNTAVTNAATPEIISATVASETINKDKKEELKVRGSPRQKAKKEQQKAEEIIVINDDDISTTTELATTPVKEETKMVAEKGSKKLKEAIHTGDEPLEPLIVLDTETFEDSPMPKAKSVVTPSGGKLLKLTNGPPPTRARISPFRRSERIQNTSTIVNLSTVSEQSTDSGLIGMSGICTPNKDKSFGTTLRTISGRKSMRPMKEIDFSTYRETYRKLPENDAFNYSLNATVGSEIHQDISFRTPIAPVIGKSRKRDRTPERRSYDDMDIKSSTVESPKRARLDVYGLLGYMASPITMLRNRLSRARLQSSTPNKNDNKTTSGDNDTNLNLSSTESNSEIVENDANVSGIEVVESIKDGEINENIDDQQNMDIEEFGDDNQDHDAEALNSDVIDDGDNIIINKPKLINDQQEDHVGTDTDKRKWCTIM